MPALGERRCFSLLARDIYPEFQLFRHPQFHMVLFPATESLSQISVLRIGRPRHTLAASHGRSNTEASLCAKYHPFCDLRPVQRHFSSPDSSKNDAVKYRQRYTNLSSTSQVHTSPYWDCICIRAGGQTPAGNTANSERPCQILKNQVAKRCWVYVSFCQNVKKLQIDWFSWSLVQLCC
jgi:hypothetical protein